MSIHHQFIFTCRKLTRLACLTMIVDENDDEELLWNEKPNISHCQSKASDKIHHSRFKLIIYDSYLHRIMTVNVWQYLLDDSGCCWIMIIFWRAKLFVHKWTKWGWRQIDTVDFGIHLGISKKGHPGAIVIRVLLVNRAILW